MSRKVHRIGGSLLSGDMPKGAYTYHCYCHVMSCQTPILVRKVVKKHKECVEFHVKCDDDIKDKDVSLCIIKEKESSFPEVLVEI